MKNPGKVKNESGDSTGAHQKTQAKSTGQARVSANNRDARCSEARTSRKGLFTIIQRCWRSA
jgi:hypothetical protein